MLAAAKEAQPAQARLQSVRVLRRQRAQAMVRRHLLQLFPQRQARPAQALYSLRQDHHLPYGQMSRGIAGQGRGSKAMQADNLLSADRLIY